MIKIQEFIGRCISIASEAIMVDTSSFESMTETLCQIFKSIGLKNRAEVRKEELEIGIEYQFEIDGKTVCSHRVYGNGRLDFHVFVHCLNICIGKAFIIYEKPGEKELREIENILLYGYGVRWSQTA